MKDHLRFTLDEYQQLKISIQERIEALEAVDFPPGSEADEQINVEYLLSAMAKLEGMFVGGEITTPLKE